MPPILAWGSGDPQGFSVAVTNDYFTATVTGPTTGAFHYGNQVVVTRADDAQHGIEVTLAPRPGVSVAHPAANQPHALPEAGLAWKAVEGTGADESVTVGRIDYFRIEVHGASKNRFSPTLGETLPFVIQVSPGLPPPLLPDGRQVFLRTEARRALQAGGWQGIGWIPTGPPDDPDLPPNAVPRPWSGIADFDAAESIGPDRFTGHLGNWFDRVLPAVTREAPVPPGIYHISTVLDLKEGGGLPVTFYRTDPHHVFVPLVVKIANALTQDEQEELLDTLPTSKPHPPPQVLVDSLTVAQVSNITSIIADRLGTYFGGNVDIRFVVTSQNIVGPFTKVSISGTDAISPFLNGRADGPNGGILPLGNVALFRHAQLFVHGTRAFAAEQLGKPPPDRPGDPPFAQAHQVFSFSRTGTHELGHLLGLVGGPFQNAGPLNGSVGRHNYYGNRPFEPRMLMNAGIHDSFDDRRGKSDGENEVTWRFNDLNRAYLEFVLPVPGP